MNGYRTAVKFLCCVIALTLVSWYVHATYLGEQLRRATVLNAMYATQDVRFEIRRQVAMEKATFPESEWDALTDALAACQSEIREYEGY